MSGPGKNDRYSLKDAAADTNSSSRETSEAWHFAREDCQNSDHPTDQHLSENWGRTPDKDR